MNREESQKVISKWCETELYAKFNSDTPMRSLNHWLYDEGYVLLSAEEVGEKE